MVTKSPSFISALVTPGPGAASGKKSWSVDVESVWVPFFTATNAQGDTNVSPETLGAPIRLAVDKPGVVRFTANGRPSMRIAPELTQQIRVVRENFIASLMNYTGTVIEENGDAYKAQVERNQAAATPLLEQDAKVLQEEMDRIAARAAEETACEEKPEEKAEEKAETPTTGRGRRQAAPQSDTPQSDTPAPEPAAV